MIEAVPLGELTTQVWERVCVCCGSGETVRRGQALWCGGCHRRILRVRAAGDDGRRQDLQLLAQEIMRDIAREEATA